MRDEIGQKRLPGAVVLIGVGDRIVYQKAIGNRALVPSAEPMTLDTIFDVASLTKVVATTTSVMMLIEQGKLRLVDRVATFIPGFERYGKADITIRHLLTHVSGLRPDVDLADEWVGTDAAIQLAVEEVPTAPPGTRFVYSDINFFLLGEIVRRVSGQPLDEFTQEHVFKPLGMKDTMFNPPASLTPRIAPTESCTPYGWPCDGPGPQDAARRRPRSDGAADERRRRPRGAVQHRRRPGDLLPHAARTTASYRGARILAPLTVAKMTTPVPGEDRNLRALGWDVDSSYSGNRGELLPIGSFGHTGFTGTSLWIDPVTRMFVVFLSNRVHPDGKGDVTPLRARVATIAASAIEAVPANRPHARRSPGAISAARRWPLRQAAAAGRFRARRAARRSIRAAPRQARRAGHQPHRPRPRRRDRHRPAVRSQGGAPRGAVQPRARHPRRARRQGAVGEGSEDRAGHPFALRRDAPADRGDARRARRHRHRSAGHRRPVLHLHDDDGVRHGRGGEAEPAGVRARSAEPDQRLPGRRARASTSRSSSSSATFRGCRCATA